MEQKVFISYASQDRIKMEDLRRAILQNYRGFEPIVVPRRRDPAKDLADKVKAYVSDADYFIPIITRESILTQWVNQEIGYAIARCKVLIPIVERRIRRNLKGFIHDKLELFYFRGSKLYPGKELLQFRKCYLKALEQLFRITEPEGEHVSDEYVEISGAGGPSGSAIILLTSLLGEYLRPQRSSVTADEKGNWKYSRCHLLNPDRERLVYALAVSKTDETKVRELLQQKVKIRTDKAMDKFAQILRKEHVPFRLTPAKRLLRHRR